MTSVCQYRLKKWKHTVQCLWNFTPGKSLLSSMLIKAAAGITAMGVHKHISFRLRLRADITIRMWQSLWLSNVTKPCSSFEPCRLWPLQCCDSMTGTVFELLFCTQRVWNSSGGRYLSTLFPLHHLKLLQRLHAFGACSHRFRVFSLSVFRLAPLVHVWTVSHLRTYPPRRDYLASVWNARSDSSSFW